MAVTLELGAFSRHRRVDVWKGKLQQVKPGKYAFLLLAQPEKPAEREVVEELRRVHQQHLYLQFRFYVLTRSVHRPLEALLHPLLRHWPL